MADTLPHEADHGIASRDDFSIFFEKWSPLAKPENERLMNAVCTQG
jgi:hypothetical protein